MIFRVDGRSGLVLGYVLILGSGLLAGCKAGGAQGDPGVSPADAAPPARAAADSGTVVGTDSPNFAPLVPFVEPGLLSQTGLYAEIPKRFPD